MDALRVCVESNFRRHFQTAWAEIVWNDKSQQRWKQFLEISNCFINAKFHDNDVEGFLAFRRFFLIGSANTNHSESTLYL